MDKDDLIRKLESIAVPQFELQSHKERLKGELLNSECLREQPRGSVLNLAKPKGVFVMLREYVSRQPIWKTATVGVTALALIAALSLTIPSFTGQSDVALAAEVAQKSEAVKLAAGGEGGIEVVKVTKVVDGKGTVVCVAEMGQMVTVDVDLKAEKVTEVEVIPMPELSNEEMAAATKIAKADPRVKELLDQGASIGTVFPIYSSGMIVTDGETKILPTIKMVMVEIKQGEKKQMARVNLEGKKVERITEPIPIDAVYPRQIPPSPILAEPEVVIVTDSEGGSAKITGTSRMLTPVQSLPVSPLAKAEMSEVIDIAKADPRVKELLNQGATLGEVIGCFTVGFVESWDGKRIIMSSSPSKLKALVPLELGEEHWTVEVDLNNKQVSRVVPNRMEHIEREVVVEEAVEIIVDVPEAEKR